jgi:hypothetical protein
MTNTTHTLSDEQITKIASKLYGSLITQQEMAFARAIEAHVLASQVIVKEVRDAALEDAEDLQRNVADLSMLVAQLVRALRKAAPAHDLSVRAMDYLQREGLCGSPLREDQP